MRLIKWNKKAIIQLNNAIIFIRSDSPQNADKVKKEILQKVNTLSISPEIYPLDKYKILNNGNYRAFEIHRYRVSYLVKERR